MSEIKTLNTKSLTSFKLVLNEEGNIVSVQRLLDNEVFSIGDYVTNGTKIQSNITKIEVFRCTDNNAEVFKRSYSYI